MTPTEALWQSQRHGRTSAHFFTWLPLAVVAVLGVITAATAYRLADAADDARVHAEAGFRADWRAADLQNKLRAFAEPVAAIVTLVGAQQSLDARLFRRFAELSYRPGEPLRRVAWVPRGAVAPSPGWDDGAAFTIELDPSSSSGNTSLAGLDLADEPARRAAIDGARDSGQPLATPPHPLRQSGVVGYVVFWPVYQDGRVPGTVEQRRAAWRGVVEGSFRLQDALEAAIRGTPPIIESIRFFAGQTTEGALPVAVYSAGVKAGDGKPLAPLAPGGIRIARSILVLGQRWTLVFDFAPTVVAPWHSGTIWIPPVAVLALTVLLAAYLLREQRYRQRVEQRVSERTAELQAANAALASEAAARQKAQEQLVQAQKMEAIGNLTGGMAHDFNNLLGVVIGNLDLLRDRPSYDPEVDELSGDALDAALRGADLTRRLLGFARRQPLQPEKVDVNKMVAGIGSLLRRTLGEQIEVVLQLHSELWPVVVDPIQLQSSIVNIANNARDAMPNGGRLTVTSSNGKLDDDYASQHADIRAGDYVLIEISDTGSGMPPEIASRIFEPFYTTKEKGQGTGLGLSMVYGFMRQSEGHINVYSEVGIGTTFRLYLPSVAEEGTAESEGQDEAQPLPRGRGETVLAVEDNAGLRRVVLRQLDELGYRTLEADTPEAALRLLEAEPVDLLFTDIVMPGGTSGYELARTALSYWPRIRIVLTSGFPDTQVSSDSRHPGIRLLSKPYRRGDLARAIRDALGETLEASAGSA